MSNIPVEIKKDIAKNGVDDLPWRCEVPVLYSAIASTLTPTDAHPDIEDPYYFVTWEGIYIRVEELCPELDIDWSRPTVDPRLLEYLINE